MCACARMARADVWGALARSSGLRVSLCERVRVCCYHIACMHGRTPSLLYGLPCGYPDMTSPEGIKTRACVHMRPEHVGGVCVLHLSRSVYVCVCVSLPFRIFACARVYCVAYK